MSLFLLFFLNSFSSVCLSQTVATVYVSANNGSDSATCGSSWDQPCLTIQTTLNNIGRLVTNVSVILDQGTYNETRLSVASDYAFISYSCPNGMATLNCSYRLTWGFNMATNDDSHLRYFENITIYQCINAVYGTSGTWFLRNVNWIQCRPAISGSGGYWTVSNSQVSYGSTYLSYPPAFNFYRTNNFTIQNTNFFSNAGNSLVFGGAISGTTVPIVLIDNCTFYNNTAATGGAVGLLLPQAGASITIRNSNFTNCYSTSASTSQGGALYFSPLVAITAKPVGPYQFFLDNLYFNSNVAQLNGGALYINSAGADMQNSSFYLSNSYFINNLAYNYGGGAYFGFLAAHQVFISVTNTIFIKNIATNSGAGLVLDSLYYVNNPTAGYAFVNTSLEVINCYFEKNEVGAGGGGVRVSIPYNYPNYTLGTGYEPDYSGWLPWNNLATFSNCTFIQNNAGQGGAMFIGSMPTIILQSVFQSNTAYFGGAIHDEGTASVIIQNSSFDKNLATSIGNDIHSISMAGILFQSTIFLINNSVSSFYVQTGGFLDDGNREAYWEYRWIASNNFIRFQDNESLFIETMYGSGISGIFDNNNPLIINGTYWQVLFFGVDSFQALTCSVYPCLNTIGVYFLRRTILVNQNSSSWLCPTGFQLINNSTFPTISTIAWSNTSNPYRSMITSNAQLSCTACPSGTYSLQNSSMIWGQDPIQITCFSCEYGADCTFGGSTILAEPGFWGQTQNDGTIAMTACPLDYCPNEIHAYDSCNGNRCGILCGKCCDGYSEALGTTNCTLTSNCNYQFLILLIPLTIIWAIYLLFLADRHGGLFRSLFFFYQMSDFCLTDEDRNTVQLQTFNIILGLFDYRMQSNGNGICFFQMDAVQKQLIQLFPPFLLFLWVLLLYLIFSVICKHRQPTSTSTDIDSSHISDITESFLPRTVDIEDTKDEYEEPSLNQMTEENSKKKSCPKIRKYYSKITKPITRFLSIKWLHIQKINSSYLYETLVLLYSTAYSTILKLSTSLLLCTQINGRNVLLIDANIDCYSWPGWIVGFLLLVIATVLPLIFLIFGFNREGQWIKSFVMVLGAPYQPMTRYWEIILILERFMIGMTSAFLCSYPYLRSSLITLFLVIFILIHVSFVPFYDTLIQKAHTLFMGCLVLMALFSTRQAAASSFATSIPGNDVNEKLNNVVVVLNLLALSIPLFVAIILFLKNLCTDSKKQNNL